MGNRGGTNNKCQRYLNSRTRMKNKTEKLDKLLSKLKDESKENAKRSCRIGRKKEGFTPEDFKKRRRNVQTTQTT